MLKRNHTQPKGFNEGELAGYFMIAKSDAALAITQKLTGTQLRLWIYLMMIDSFGDSTADGEAVYHKIPSPGDIAVKIGASCRTVEKDLNLLRDLGLYDYKVVEWWGHNKTAKRAKETAKTLKVNKDKGGYLAADSVKQPESVLNNRDGGNLTVIPAKKCGAHNIDRARDQTYSNLDQTHTDNAPPEPGAPPTQEVCVPEQVSSEPQEPVVRKEITETPSPSLAEESEGDARTDISHEDKSFAPARDNTTRYAHNQSEYPKNIDGSDHLPWETRRSPREFEPGFERHMEKSLENYPAYKGLLGGELITKVRKHIAGAKYDLKRRDELAIEWDAYQTTLAQASATSEPARKPSNTSEPTAKDVSSFTEETKRLAAEDRKRLTEKLEKLALKKQQTEKTPSRPQPSNEQIQSDLKRLIGGE